MKTTTARVRFALAAVLMLGVAAQAQVTRFETRETREMRTWHGSYTAPFTVGIIKDDYEKYKAATKEYAEAMSAIFNDYLGFKKDCSMDSLFFLPGDTEASFRKAEKTLVNGFATQGFKRLGKTLRPALKKSYPVKQFPKGSASFYIYGSDPKNPSPYYAVHGYIFSKEAKQGTLMICRGYGVK